MQNSTPVVSIGLPVFNGEKTLVGVLESILQQSFANFELIISNNDSTDKTEEICLEYAKKDSRIHYFRQLVNLGPGQNFKFVRDKARAPYFMWAACDDIRSPDFLDENIRFLEENPDYVASTSPDCFENQYPVGVNLNVFSVCGFPEERIIKLLMNCWRSNGIFYSVMRTEIVRGCDLVGTGFQFTAGDWAFDLYLASRGNIHRTRNGLTVFGRHGISNRTGAYNAFRSRRIEFFIPLYHLSKYTLKISADFSLQQRIQIMSMLFMMNARAFGERITSDIYEFYCLYLKRYIRRIPINYKNYSDRHDSNSKVE